MDKFNITPNEAALKQIKDVCNATELNLIASVRKDMRCTSSDVLTLLIFLHLNLDGLILKAQFQKENVSLKE